MPVPSSDALEAPKFPGDLCEEDVGCNLGQQRLEGPPLASLWSTWRKESLQGEVGKCIVLSVNPGAQAERILVHGPSGAGSGQWVSTEASALGVAPREWREPPKDGMPNSTPGKGVQGVPGQRTAAKAGSFPPGGQREASSQQNASPVRAGLLWTADCLTGCGNASLRRSITVGSPPVQAVNSTYSRNSQESSASLSPRRGAASRPLARENNACAPGPTAFGSIQPKDVRLADGSFSAQKAVSVAEPAALLGDPATCPCLVWLLDWETRQERLLRQHEDATRQLVETLRRDLLGRPKEERPRCHSRELQLCTRSSKSINGSSPYGSERTMKAMEQRVQAMATMGTKWSQHSRGSPKSAAVAVDFMPSMTAQTPPKPSDGYTPSRRNLLQPEPKSKVRAFISSVVHSHAFTLASSSMIALYTIAVGIMADAEMRSAVSMTSTPDWLWYVDIFFTVSFAGEVVLRFFADGLKYLTGPGRSWNIFDVCVAAAALLDVLSPVEMNLGFLRILRACRAIRVLRVLRAFPILKDLRLMAESVCACIPSLAWAITLLGSVQYIFAVVLLRAASEKLNDGSMAPANAKVLRDKFCNLSWALFSLTEAISGGRSWGEYAEPFIEVSPFFGACFPIFVVFVIFGAVNILTSIFVESTSCIANYDKELAVEEEMNKAEQAIAQIRDFFEELDEDGSGTLSMNELEKAMMDPKVKAYFSVLQIDVSDSRSLFQLLDRDQSGDVNIEEFIEKCMRIRGTAKAMDVAAMRRENKTTRRRLEVLMKTIEDRFANEGTRPPVQHEAESRSGGRVTRFATTASGY